MKGSGKIFKALYKILPINIRAHRNGDNEMV